MANESTGWKVCNISDVASVTAGFGFPPSLQGKTEGDIPFYKVGDISKASLSRSQFLTKAAHYINLVDAQSIKATPIPKGSIVFAKIGESLKLNRRAILSSESLVDNNVMALIPKDNIDSKYLFYFFLTQDLGVLSAGNAVPSIRKSVVEKIQIPLAPPAEQQRIVAKLDKLFSHLDQLKARLDKVPELLKQFRQAVLTMAVTGKLTEEWRKSNARVPSGMKVLSNCLAHRKRNWETRTLAEFKTNNRVPNNGWQNKYVEPLPFSSILFNDLPSSWANGSWDQITDWITYGFTRPMPHVENGVPIVTGKNVINGIIDFQHLEYTTLDAFEELNEKDRPKQGDLLVTKDGTIGRSAVVQTDEKFCINQSVAVCWLRGYNLNRKFLLFVVLSEITQNEIRLKSKGVAVQHLSVTDFRKMHLPVPSIEEQNEIVQRVESLFAAVERIEAQNELLKEKIESLPKTTLSKAFKGELSKAD